MLVDAPQYIVARNVKTERALYRSKKHQQRAQYVVARKFSRRCEPPWQKALNRPRSNSWQEALTGAQQQGDRWTHRTHPARRFNASRQRTK
jgi:hypothetical protein